MSSIAAFALVFMLKARCPEVPFLDPICRDRACTCAWVRDDQRKCYWRAVLCH